MSTAQIFYSLSAQPRQRDMQENYRSDCKVCKVLIEQIDLDDTAESNSISILETHLPGS